tara:strand:+ start:124 stop:573 length:450 start_codon:yes stop_codon:yes gene_type:complete
MIENIEKDQLQDICSGLLKGFIEWVDMNDEAEKAIILDSAYQFKLSMLEQGHETLQKKYFLSSQKLSEEELIILLNQWKETFSQLVNSDLDRVSKDSFKIWFLSLASSTLPSLEEDGRILWTKLIEGLEHCKNFTIEDIPFPLNTITKN